MDARKNGANRAAKEEITQQPPEPKVEPFDVNYGELKQALQISTNRTVERLDQLINSSSKNSNKRAYYELFQALVVDSARSSESLIYLFEYVVDLRASVLFLSLEVEKTKGKTAKEVKNIKSKIDTLLNSPAMVEIGKVLQNINKIGEDRKKKQEKNPTKEYLR
jgi:hypothetical protein